MLGLAVEAVTPIRRNYPSVVEARVLEAKRHPNADKLSVCRVYDGQQELQVVCGASNVRKDLLVALALPGAVLPGEVKIRKSKIRGEDSCGMICSERELELGQGHEGILELSEGEIGAPLDTLFAYEDECIEIEVTPNRPDWLSHLGVARELSAAYGRPLRLPATGPDCPLVARDGGLGVRIEAPELCWRFTARRIDGVRVGPSPIWMRQRLLAIGLRPINAVVDASNYVLHECGQPTHVFDRAKLAPPDIVVRRARRGERLLTLDGVERELDDQLLIADAQRPLGLGGILGGATSEVDAESRELLVEAAHFAPAAIRRGRRQLGLSTDASYRFERGVDPERLNWASRRVSELIVAHAGGQASPNLIEARGTAPARPAPFFVRSAQVERLIGVAIPAAQMAASLARLGIAAKASDNGVELTPPSFRHDLIEEVDAIEELARHHGYDALPPRERTQTLPAQRDHAERLRRRLRETLAARRYHEVVGTSFMPDDDPQTLGLAPDDARRRAVRVLNPVVAESASLRTTALPEMLRILDRNRRRGLTGPIRLFQLERCFLASEAPLPQEREGLSLLWAGPVQPAHFLVSQRAHTLFDALGEIEALLASEGLVATRRSVALEPYHRAGSSVGLALGDRWLGSVAQLDPRIALRFDLEEPVFVAELDWDVLRAAVAASGIRKFEPISSFPPVRRDLSLLVPLTVPYAEVCDVVRGGLGVLLESLEVFDLYQGSQVPAGQRAIGLRLSLRSQEGTLKDAKVDALLARVLEQLALRHVALREVAPLPPLGEGA
jgi:phenylalanyl-tRNA synthetase beta chain